MVSGGIAGFFSGLWVRPPEVPDVPPLREKPEEGVAEAKHRLNGVVAEVVPRR